MFRLAATEKGLCVLTVGEWEDGFWEEVRHRVPGALLRRGQNRLEPYVKQLTEYLEGRRQQFDLPLDLSGTEFQHLVWQALRLIPYGETRSYRQVAEMIGRPQAARAVGGACNRNPVMLFVPCHRVVGSKGQLVGFGGGLALKRWLLELEQHGLGASL